MQLVQSKYHLIVGRNIVNQDEISKFLSSFSHGEPHIEKWLNSNLRNWILNKSKEVIPHAPSLKDPAWVEKALSRGDKLYDFKPSEDLKNKISHLIDYFKSKKPRLDRMSAEDAFKNLEVWDKSAEKKALKERKKVLKETTQESGVETLKKYPSGYSWVEVKTAEALTREGILMGHCVGGEDYCKAVLSKSMRIFSLRDKQNKPHCTIELSNREIKQIKGIRNSGIAPELQKYVQDFLKRPLEGVIFSKIHDLKNIGMLEATDGTWYSISNLPPKWEGDLDLRDMDISRLPKTLEVSGDLLLWGSKIGSMPETLIVDGFLDLAGSSITALPTNLKVGGSLDLSQTNISSLPNNLQVGHDLHIAGTQIASLPDSLKVKVKGKIYA